MSKTDRQATAFAPGEGNVVWCVGSLSAVKADGNQTDGAYAIVEDLSPKGSGPPFHYHNDDEAFYVLEGEITIYVQNREPIAGVPGTFVHVPANTVHGFRVESETARHLIITTPHHLDFYLAMSEPAQTRSLPPDKPMDMEIVGAACEKYGVHGVGPLPGDE